MCPDFSRYGQFSEKAFRTLLYTAAAAAIAFNNYRTHLHATLKRHHSYRTYVEFNEVNTLAYEVSEKLVSVITSMSYNVKYIYIVPKNNTEKTHLGDKFLRRILTSCGILYNGSKVRFVESLKIKIIYLTTHTI